MKPNIPFIKQKFSKLNAMCFEGLLPEPLFRLNNSRNQLGCFGVERIYPAYSSGPALRCYIKISTRLDLPEQEVTDTILHEMIHYWVWYNNLKDSSPHGPVFKKKMNEINRRYGFGLSVSYRGPKEIFETDTRKRNHYICLLSFRNGDKGICLAPRTRIFEFNRTFESSPEILKADWFWSQDPWFNRFRTMLKPGYYLLDDDTCKRYLKSATECLCDGQRFGPKPKR